MKVMKVVKDIVVSAFRDAGAANIEAISEAGAQFMDEQFGQRHAHMRGEDVNDFFGKLRERDITFRFVHG